MGRAGLKYAHKAVSDGYSAEYHAEAHAYFLFGAGWIQQATGSSTGTAKDVLEMLKPELTTLPATLYCDVKTKLIPTYAPLGLDCTKVGTWKSLPSGTTCSGAPACPSVQPSLPTGLSSYDFTPTTSAGSNVDCPEALPTSSTTGTTGVPAAASSTVRAVLSLRVSGLPVIMAAFASFWLLGMN